MLYTNTILVVDDDCNTRTLLTASLVPHGYTVEQAASGIQGLKRAAEIVPDAILLDVWMPDIDGIEFCHRVRHDPQLAEVPIVMITADHDVEIRQRSIEAGADDFVLKPFDLAEIQARLRTITRLSHFRRLLAERARFDRVVELSVDGILVVDGDETIHLANPAMVRLMSAEGGRDIIGARLASIMAVGQPETPDNTRLHEVLMGLTDHARLETWLLREDDSRLPVEITVGPFDWNDQPAALLVVRDITRRRQAQEALEESRRTLESREQFISRILESVPSSLVVIDRAMRVVAANHNFLDKARRDLSSTLGRKVEEVFPPVLLEYTQLLRKAHGVFRSGQSIEGGRASYRAPGLATRIYYYRLIPLKVGDEVEHVMLLMDDITEREQLGKEVRRAEAHLASVVECANDLVVSLDLQGHITTWNRAAESVSGLKDEDVKGQPLAAHCSAEQQGAMQEMLKAVALSEPVRSTEANLVTADGQEVPIAWSCSRMQDEAGTTTGIVAVGRDLTERRLLEAQVTQSAKMASLGVMARGIAHELRNPLGIISASAQLLSEHEGEPAMCDECIEKILAATQRASLIIENLLKFARPQEEHMMGVDVNELLQQTLPLLANQMTLQRVKWEINLSPALPSVYGNPGLLQQVLTNLILNACNAMPTGGRLTITTQVTSAGPAESGSMVEILVADTGQGIAPEHLPKIFDPFFTTMPVGKGIGLGLSISYSIVQQHGGTVDVQSRVGQGTTCIVRLPCGGDDGPPGRTP
jgi:PAS domain S-box-containing protein